MRSCPGLVGWSRWHGAALTAPPLRIVIPPRRKVELLQRQVQQAQAALEAERRSAASTRSRLVAENLVLVKSVQELLGGSGGGSGGKPRGVSGGGKPSSGATSITASAT